MAKDNEGEGYGFAESDAPRETGPEKPAGDRPRGKKAKKKRPEAEPVEKPTAGAPKPPSPLVLIAILVPVIGFIVFMAVSQSRKRTGEQASFVAEMDKWVAPPAAGPVKATPGKVALIDVNKRELHYLHDRNNGPEAHLQAATPAETATVVQVRVTDKPMREYLNGRKGVKQTFHLTVIDKASWKKIGERTFEGGDPPESIPLKRGGGTTEPVIGPLPSKEIYAYLQEVCGG